MQTFRIPLPSAPSSALCGFSSGCFETVSHARGSTCFCARSAFCGDLERAGQVRLKPGHPATGPAPHLHHRAPLPLLAPREALASKQRDGGQGPGS